MLLAAPKFARIPGLFVGLDVGPLRIRGQPIDFILCMVEAAGIEPASASPLPQALHAYSIYCFNRSLPDRQGTRTAIPKVLARRPRTCRYAILRVMTPECPQGTWTHRHGSSQTAPLPGIKRRERSCRRSQLSFLQMDLRGLLRLGMHLKVSRLTSKPSRPQIIQVYGRLRQIQGP